MSTVTFDVAVDATASTWLRRRSSLTFWSEMTGCSVYRYYDAHDLLIYVGITGRGEQRNHEHGTVAVWWPFVVRQEVEHLPDQNSARKRERELIRQFRPPFNKVHNPDWHQIRAAYLAVATAPVSKMSALDAYNAIGRAFTIKRFTGDEQHRWIWVNTSDATPVLPHLGATCGTQIAYSAGRRVGPITKVEVRGFTACIEVHGRRAGDYEHGTAWLKYDTKAKCVRVKSITLNWDSTVSVRP